MPQVYDIAVLGATPAGYAAAGYLGSKGKSVVLLDTPDKGHECPLVDWVPAEFFKLRHLPKTLAADCEATNFRTVCYHNVALDKDVRHTAKKTAGMFVDYTKLCDALKRHATDMGAKIRSTKTPPAIQLEEDRVQIVGTTQVKARLLIITHSRPADVLADLALPARTVSDSQVVAAGLDVPAKGLSDDFQGVMHLVELPERSELGIFYAFGENFHFRVVSNSPAAGNRAAELSAMVASLQQTEIVPAGIQLGRARGAVWHPPAGVALELETHTAKRCLLAGTAGGFAESITGQTLRPCVESAILAADAALAALKSDNTQEKLMEFEHTWREQLANYLRPPNTSLHLLLPLLFVNQNIVEKFTAALLRGENI